MQLPPERPFVLVCCYAVLRAAAAIVPEKGLSVTRSGWLEDWRGRAFSRWQFLQHTALWSRREAALLFIFCLSSFLDAVKQVTQQERFRQGLHSFVQSPRSCILLLLGLIGLIAGVSGGLPSTRDLIFKKYDRAGGHLVFAWLHTMRAGGDHPLPSDVIPAWNKHGKLLDGAASFRATHLSVTPPGGTKTRALVVTTESGLFKVLGIKPAAGDFLTTKGVVLGYEAWSRLFHADPRVLGSKVIIDNQIFPVSAILPAHVEPLTRQPVLYLLIPNVAQADVFAALRVRTGVKVEQLDAELIKIAETDTYDFLQGQLRYSYAQSALLTPIWSFAVAALSSGVLLLAVFRTKWTFPRQAFRPEHRKTFSRQAFFFCTKTLLALAVVFTACLEWSRSSSAILFGTFDPASGPFLLWLYIVGTMGVFFWTVVDQKARCRECLRLLAFPVRVGSPGAMLLDWSGTEFCCSEGHGILHVPHLAPSWSEKPDHWIALDDSWQSLFHDDKRKSD